MRASRVMRTQGVGAALCNLKLDVSVPLLLLKPLMRRKELGEVVCQKRR